MVALPRVVIAAAASGQGKTTVAVGLMAALARRGVIVSPAKIGPDFIDPGYHALATGRPGRNLDPWLQGEERILPLLLHGAATPGPADVAVIEGVMGLHDGRLGTGGWASTAHVAKLTESPVLLVIDISSAARTIAAIVYGLRSFDPAVRVVGVILNKAGSARHAAEVRSNVEATGLPVLGVLPRDAGVSVPSRHLGLVPVAERPQAQSALDHLAEQMTTFVDLDAFLDLARSAPPLDVRPWEPPVTVDPGEGGRPVVAMAGGRAFTFRYAETDELLRSLGCDVRVFDPAVDTSLPPGTAGLYLGGGFPEVHAKTLASNSALLQQIRTAVNRGLPTVAECAGLLYLCRSVDGHDFVGAVPAAAEMSPRLTLRYRTATLPADGLLGPAGTTVRGHEFHRTQTSPRALAGAPGWSLAEEGDHPQENEGFALAPAGRPSLHASYLHVHWAGHPELAESFCRAVHAYATNTAPASSAIAPAATTPDALETTSTEPDLAYHGDQEIEKGLIDLAVNVRVTTPPEWLAAALREEVQGLASYPDASAARSALAQRHGVAEDMILPTNGAAEAFTLLAQALRTQRPVVIHPQFTEPEVALSRSGKVVHRHILTAADDFALHPEMVDPAADLVVVGNPTNPTGVLHPRATLDALRAPGRVLVVDEAFMDAIPGEAESVLGAETLAEGDLTGVLVLRSLTKTWGLAGLRAGYMVGDPALVAALEEHQSPWSVNSLALRAMCLVSTPEAIAAAQASTRELAWWRSHLVQSLARIGLRPVPTQAPFVLAHAGRGVREILRHSGYTVRRGDTFPGLDPSWVRIAVRDPETTDGLIRALGAARAQIMEHAG